MTGARARVALVILGALVLQHSVFAVPGPGGVRADLLLLVALTAGVVGGSERGAVVGFVAGLVFDLFVQTPLGLSALAYSLVAYAAGSLQSGVIRSAWWIPPLSAAAGSAAGVVLYALMGATIGQAQYLGPRLGLTAAVVGTVNAALALPAEKAMTWAMAGSRARSYVR